MIKKIAKTLFLSCILLVISLNTVAIAGSIPQYNIAFKNNDNVSFSLAPGASVTQEFSLENLDADSAIEIGMYLSDYAKSATSVDGSIPKDWIKFSDETLSIQPKEKKYSKMTISVPKGVSDGLYIVNFKARLDKVIGKQVDKSSGGAGVVATTALGNRVKIYVSYTPSAEKTVENSTDGTSAANQPKSNILSNFAAMFSNISPLYIEILLVILVVLLLLKLTLKKNSGADKKKK